MTAAGGGNNQHRRRLVARMRERRRRTLELRQRNRREAWARRTHDSIVRAVSSAVSDFERLGPAVDPASDSALAVVDEIEGSVRNGLERLRQALQRMLSEQDELGHAGEVAGPPPDLQPAGRRRADLAPVAPPRADLAPVVRPRADRPRADPPRGTAPDAGLGGRLGSSTSGPSSRSTSGQASAPSEPGRLNDSPPLVPGRLNRVGQRAQEGVRRRVSMVVAMPQGAGDPLAGDPLAGDNSTSGVAPADLAAPSPSPTAAGGNEILARLLAYCDDDPAPATEPVAGDASAADQVTGGAESADSPPAAQVAADVSLPAPGPEPVPPGPVAGAPEGGNRAPQEVHLRPGPVPEPEAGQPAPEGPGTPPNEPVVITDGPGTAGPATAGRQQDPTATLVAVARALADPDESVRSSAVGGLAGFEPAVVEQWVVATLRSADLPDAVLAAGVVEALRMTGAAGDALERAARTDPGSRTPFVDALASLPLEPGDLLALLAFVQPGHRQEAARVCAELRGVDLVSYLEGLASDPSSRPVPGVTGLVGHGLALAPAQVLGDPVVVDQDPGLPGGAGTVTGPIEDPHVPRLLWRALRESSQAQQETLLALFAQLRPAGGSQLLASLGLAHAGDDAPSDRLLALQLASRGGGPSAGQVVIVGLRDTDDVVRAEAATQLVRMGSAAAVTAVRAVLGDHDATVRRRAVEALPSGAADMVLPALIFALNDPDADVRRATESVLERCPGAADALAGALVDPEVGPPAERLLLAWGDAVVPVLERRLIEGEAIGAAAARLLVAREGTGRFTAVLSSLDADDRLRAVEVIGAVGGPEAVDPLAARLTDPDHRVRARAVRHLGRLGDVRTLPEIVRVSLTDPVAAVAAAAGEALAALESSRVTASGAAEPGHDQPQSAPGPDYGPPGVPDPDLPGSDDDPDDVEPDGPPGDREYEDPS